MSTEKEASFGLEEEPETPTGFAMEDEPEEEKLPPELEAKILEIKERGNQVRTELRSKVDDLMRKTEGWDSSGSPFEKDVRDQVAWALKRLDEARPEWFLIDYFTQSAKEVVATLDKKIHSVEEYNALSDAEKTDVRTKALLSRRVTGPLEVQLIFTKPGRLVHEFGKYRAEQMAKEELATENKK
jgi:hypothetical protein